MVEGLYPPIAFRFSVSFEGARPNVEEAAFQEVSGLEPGLATETIAEGGENRFVHKLPKAPRTSPLKLKRGVARASGSLVSWCKSTIESGFSEPIRPKDLAISLLDHDGQATARWSISRAFPVKWSAGGMDAMNDQLAIEEIELAYATLERTS